MKTKLLTFAKFAGKVLLVLIAYRIAKPFVVKFLPANLAAYLP